MLHKQLREDPNFWKWFWSVWSFDWTVPKEGMECCVCEQPLEKGAVAQRRKIYADEACYAYVTSHSQCPNVENPESYPGLIALAVVNPQAKNFAHF
jgi:hypothetical protein